jgi:hypothetical protein
MTDKTDFTYDDLFHRSLKRMSPLGQDWTYGENKIPHDGVKGTLERDKHSIDYHYNSSGYRCSEFNDQKIMILGCSETFGYGLPVEKTWPYILSEKMNMDYVNLAKPGDGLQAQVIKAFQFFKEYHNPKYIFGVFPMNRLEFPYVKDKFGISGGHSDSYIGKEDMKFIQQSFLSSDDSEKYSKSPYDANKIIPVEVATFYNFMFLQMLEQYCESNSIKFLWTPVDKNYLQNEKIKNFKGVFTEPSFLWLNAGIKSADCHQEFKDYKLFHHAADHEFTMKNFKTHGHWGLHQHLHIAETIHNML